MNKTLIIAIILGVLVLVSTVQAFQLNGLKTKLTEQGSVSGSTVSTSPSTTGRTASVPSSVTDLPQMVGGC